MNTINISTICLVVFTSALSAIAPSDGSLKPATQLGAPPWVAEVKDACLRYLESSQHPFKISAIEELKKAQWIKEKDQLSGIEVYRSGNIVIADPPNGVGYKTRFEWNDGKGNLITLLLTLRRDDDRAIRVTKELRWRHH